MNGIRDVLNLIPYGHRNTLTRHPNKVIDRMERKIIEKANTTDDCIINVGQGYYRPIPGDPVDEMELKEYLATELKRARSIQHKRLQMRLAFESRREIETLGRAHDGI